MLKGGMVDAENRVNVQPQIDCNRPLHALPLGNNKALSHFSATVWTGF